MYKIFLRLVSYYSENKSMLDLPPKRKYDGRRSANKNATAVCNLANDSMLMLKKLEESEGGTAGR